MTVLWGSAGGLRGATTVHQGTPGVPGVNESGDRWGATLAVGDLDGDGIDDLAVGAPGETLGGRSAVGLGHGLRAVPRAACAATPPSLWHQGTPRRAGRERARRRLGLVVGVGRPDRRRDRRTGRRGTERVDRTGSGGRGGHDPDRDRRRGSPPSGRHCGTRTGRASPASTSRATRGVRRRPSPTSTATASAISSSAHPAESIGGRGGDRCGDGAAGLADGRRRRG